MVRIEPVAISGPGLSDWPQKCPVASPTVPDGARQHHRFRLPGGAVGEYERRFERVCRGGVVSVLQRAVEAA